MLGVSSISEADRRNSAYEAERLARSRHGTSNLDVDDMCLMRTFPHLWCH